MSNIPQPAPQTINLSGISSEESVGEILVSLSSEWAELWFEDALTEARASRPKTTGFDRRKEILFAVCCAEAYLLEWVYNDVLARALEKLAKYFPRKKRRGVDQKWREIPKEIHADGLIPNQPDLGGSHGERWATLLGFRDGLIHASASLPDTGLTDVQKPTPSLYDLNTIEAGWATRIIVERIRKLHDAAKTPVPSWLQDP